MLFLVGKPGNQVNIVRCSRVGSHARMGGWLYVRAKREKLWRCFCRSARELFAAGQMFTWWVLDVQSKKTLRYMHVALHACNTVKLPDAGVDSNIISALTRLLTRV